MSFRLKKFKLDDKNLQLPLVKLTNGNDSEDNYFTVVIGNNGTGKSRFLRGIVDSYRKRNVGHENFSLQDKINNPQKLIAITTSLSDKFPSDSSFSRQANPNIIREQYCYLGPRGRVGGSSNRALMDKAISFLMSGFEEKSNFYQYNEIFNYLKYEPVLKLAYKVRVPVELKDSIESIDGENLKSFIAMRSENRSGIRQGTYSRFLSSPEP